MNINIEPVLQKFITNEIIILGLGREGRSTYEFFRKQLPEKKLWIIDQKAANELDPYWHKVISRDRLVEFSTHLEHTELDDARAAGEGIVVIKTPGIPPHNELIKQAQALDASFTSNSNIFFALIEFVNEHLKPNSIQSRQQTTSEELEVTLPAITTIGITGTKGKSTTTAAIAHVLKTAGISTHVGGNIGTAPLSLWNTVSSAATSLQASNTRGLSSLVFVVLELSSHQLDGMRFSPHIATVLDITPEHLDFYENFEAYVHAKAQICRFQTTSDFVVYDPTKQLPSDIANLANTTKLHFSDNNIFENWIRTKNGSQIVDIDSLALVGHHTIYNTLPAVTIAHFLGISTKTIEAALKSFKPLRHRLELIATKNEVSYYNDSLSTTPVATIAALKSFQNQPIILIAGGYDRGLDYSQLASTILEHQVKHVILLPETGEIIRDEIEARLENNMGTLTLTEVTSLKSAVTTAQAHSESGDIVLLSPASASFNMFKNYAERGDKFIEYVSNL